MNTQTEMTVEAVDAMSGKRLNQYVLEAGLEGLPDYFITLKPAEKKEAVKSALGFDVVMPADKSSKSSKKPKASTAVAKGKSKDKKPVATAKGTAVALPSDFPTLVSIDIDKITTEAEAVEVAMKLVEVGDYATYHLGGVFCKMIDENWYGEHSDFRQTVEVDFGVKYRKAAYLMRIYRTITDKKISWEQIAGCGWTKLKELLPILTPANASKWAEKAKGMSTVALTDHVKNALAKGKGNDPDAASDNPVSTKTFKLHDDQKKVVMDAISDAKQKAGTEVDSVALELVCQDYLGASKPINPVSVAKKHFKDVAGTEAGLKLLLSLLDKHFGDVVVDLTIPESYGIG
jgi:hypothetical protein